MPRDREPRGVGGDQRVRPDVGGDLGEEAPLDVQVLDDGLDDQVTLLEFAQVVLEVAGGDQAGHVGIEEGRRLGLQRLLDRLEGELVARLRVRLVFVVEVGGDDVEEVGPHACAGEVGGNAGAHHASAEDGGRLDSVGHIGAEARTPSR
jgi:hypothetical protein